jgi:sugar lactone lactonase YvrE
MRCPLSFSLALAGLGIACGPAEPPAPGSGDIVTLIGTGEQATDAPAFDDAGEPIGVELARAHLDSPVDIAFDANERLYVLDWNGHKIRAVDDGKLHPFVGTGLEGDACETQPNENGCPCTSAQVNHPTDLTFDAEGVAIIAAWHNSKLKVVDPDTGRLTDLCGSGGRDYLGDGGPCFDEDGAQLVTLDLPSSVVFDGEGNLFFADQANQVVRRLDRDGVVTTVVGSCPKGGFGCPEGVGYSGDGGPALEAKLDNGYGQWVMPAGKLAFGPDGFLYIADTFNNVIRRVDPGPDGVLGSGDSAEEKIETFAGTSEQGHDGDGGPAAQARLNRPTDLAWSTEGELFIADRGNHCIRRIAGDTISTVAGQCGVPGSTGDGGPATRALFDEPFGIAIGPDDALYIADTLNHRVRLVLP